nr:MAG TPA: hypothetical protein [Caudoviricetes sp.]
MLLDNIINNSSIPLHTYRGNRNKKQRWNGCRDT